jgi:hypothetical protein
MILMAICQAPPLDDASMLRHLHEYALEVRGHTLKVHVICVEPSNEW